MEQETVQHMKWWGWGVDGVAFDHSDKPRLAPFVLDNVDVDLDAPGRPPTRFEDLAVPATTAPAALTAALVAAVGPAHVRTDDLDRVVHTYGKSLRDLVRLRAGDLPRVPDAVVYPADEDEVRALVDAVVDADAVTEVTVQVHRVPERRVVLGYFFPTWSAGVAALREISASDAAPSITRVSDAPETAFSFATRRRSTGVPSLVSKGLMQVLERRGWDLSRICLSFVGFEGGRRHVARQRRMVRAVVRRHGGIVVGTGPGRLYDQKKFDTPYIRDFLLDRGALADVSETAAPWSQIPALYERTVEAAEKALRRSGSAAG